MLYRLTYTINGATHQQEVKGFREALSTKFFVLKCGAWNVSLLPIEGEDR